MNIAIADSFVAYPSRWRLALLMMLGLGFVALGFWMIGAFGSVPSSTRYPYLETLIVGWVCLIFSGVCVVAYISRLLEAGQQMRVDASGILFSQWSDATIPWSQISDVTVRSYQSSRFIIIHLKNRRLYPGKGLTGLLAGPNRMMTGGDISLSLSGTDRSYDEAISAIEQYRPLTLK